MSIGTRIMQIRNRQNLTQRVLSERTGIATSYLSRVENRRLEPRPKTLRKIAEALGVPVAELFEETPTAHEAHRCAITASGNCIMELLRSERGKRARTALESYSPRQLQLLRVANYLIQSGDPRLLETLDVLLGALLKSAGGAQAKSLALADARL
jgi:transcriptional regulator with XRE-family HTH domain